MKVTRFDAALTYVLVGLALWISYSELADLASRAGLGSSQAAAWPLLVDGLILAATRAVVTFGGHDARRYAWKLLGCAAAASVAGNAAHAMLPPGPVHPAIAAVVAVVPPLAALATTHLAVVHARVRRDAEQTDASDALPLVEDVTQGVEPETDSAPPNATSNAPRTDDALEPLNCASPTQMPARYDAPGLFDEPTAPDATKYEIARQRALELIVAGEHSGRAIADTVGVSESTVRRWKRDAASESSGLIGA